MAILKMVTAAALLGPTLGPCRAELVLVKDDCVRGEAFDVKGGRTGVRVGGTRFRRGTLDADGNPCPPLRSAEVVLYRETNNIPGFQEGQDEFVEGITAESGTPTNELLTGSFSTVSPEHGTADSWEVTVTDWAENQNIFSGTI